MMKLTGYTILGLLVAVPVYASHDCETTKNNGVTTMSCTSHAVEHTRFIKDGFCITYEEFDQIIGSNCVAYDKETLSLTPIPCPDEQDVVIQPEVHYPTKFHYRLRAGITDEGFQLFINGQPVGGTIEDGKEFAVLWLWIHYNLDDLLEKIGCTREKGE